MIRVKFDPKMSYDGGVGGIAVFCPSGAGWVNYNFVHSVVSKKNCDTWRMSVANAVDSNGNVVPLTKNSAEWEMAIRLEGRPDFIGGFNHGDERGEIPKILVDGKETVVSLLTEETECENLEISIDSAGFDPASPEDMVLRHHKHFTVSEKGVALEQKIRWLRDVVLDGRIKSYLAMMPPMKHEKDDPFRLLTDSYSFNGEEEKVIEALPVKGKGVSKITVSGRESGISFSMEAAAYEPCYPSSYDALLTDNGSHLNYNKMYIAFAGGSSEAVPAGTVWKAVTRYQIKLPE